MSAGQSVCVCVFLREAAKVRSKEEERTAIPEEQLIQRINQGRGEKASCASGIPGRCITHGEGVQDTEH